MSEKIIVNVREGCNKSTIISPIIKGEGIQLKIVENNIEENIHQNIILWF